MSVSKNQRIVLITGGNRGIGLETAMQLATRGYHVVVSARDKLTGQKAVEKLTAGGGNGTFLTLDVSSSESIRKAANEFRKIADHLDVLINNAGIYPDEGVNILTINRQRMIDALETNTLGPLDVTQAFLP